MSTLAQCSTLDSIDHINISVSNLDQAVAWYQTSFSCELVTKESTFAVLRFRNVDLHLTLPSQQPPHLAFEREDADTFGELRVQPDGRQSIFCSDSSGNPIELIMSACQNPSKVAE